MAGVVAGPVGDRDGAEVTPIPSVAGSPGFPDGGGLTPMLMVWARTRQGCLTAPVFIPQQGCLTTRPIEGIRRGKLQFAWSV
jgi:hypothetical protein